MSAYSNPYDSVRDLTRPGLEPDVTTSQPQLHGADVKLMPLVVKRKH